MVNTLEVGRVYHVTHTGGMKQDYIAARVLLFCSVKDLYLVALFRSKGDAENLCNWEGFNEYYYPNGYGWQTPRQLDLSGRFPKKPNKGI